MGRSRNDAVEKFSDYQEDIRNLLKSNVLEFDMVSSKILVRPSGTEPKIKIYLSSRASSMTEASHKNQNLLHALTDNCRRF